MELHLPLEFYHESWEDGEYNIEHMNLPIPLTSFIGREQELLHIKRLLAATRLLTLTGPGGSGKTRLALQVATELSANASMTDGVWWVELAAVTNPTSVPQAIGTALGVHESPEQSASETLTNYLRDQDMLLVLDNCEHLVSVTAQLCELLLRACPHLKILTTSREALAISAEQIWLVPPLTLPGSPQSSTVQDVLKYEAIRLFVERARAINPAFALIDNNVSAVLQICERLDGIPLAIELAAVRVKVLSVAQIASRLDDRFNLLTGGTRTALPRHQTLRATIDWSYDLLSPHEKILFRRLSVFARDWTLEAAEAICSDASIQVTRVLDLLTALVDRSLVLVEEWGGTARYRMLETIREYAREKLLAENELTVLRARHLDYFVELAEQAESEMGGPKRMAWFNALERDFADLTWALEAALTLTDRIEKGLRLAGALNEFWAIRSHQVEGSRRLNTLLAASRTYQIAPAVRAKALYTAGILASERGEYVVARELLKESVILSRRAGSPRGLGIALIRLAKVVDSQGDNKQARVLSDESTRVLREAGEKWGLAFALALEWQIVLPTADEASMCARLQESLNLFEELGDKWSIAEPLYSLGHFMTGLGKYREARSYFERFLPIAREMDQIWTIATTRMALATIALAERDYQESEVLYEQSLDTWRKLGVKRFIASCLLKLGHLAENRGDDTRAISLYAESLRAAVESDQTDPMRSNTITFCLAGLAEIWAEHGKALAAAHLLGAIKTILDETNPSYIFIPFPRFAQTDFDRVFAVVQKKTEPGGFPVAFADGRALTQAQAIDYALAAVQVTTNDPFSLPPNHAPGAGSLTGREREVAILVAQGRSNREIAAQLVLSERTVENHLTHIFAKLDFHSRAQIAAWAVEQRLLKNPL